MNSSSNGAKKPSKVRLRLYFINAICIFGKEFGSADPYIKFTIGKQIESLRNMPCLGTNEPQFYRTEERDIALPEQSRLMIDLSDIGEVPGAGLVGRQDKFDSLMGSTILDLEDRWHSDFLSKKMKSTTESIPRESRPLCIVDASGKQTVTGSLLMWIEMIDSKDAADNPATPLTKPAPMQIEIRFVIWTCQDVKLVDNGKCDVRVGVNLQCDAYTGEYPKMQKTDTHFGSLGPAVFNWRMVYPKVICPVQACLVDLTLFDYNLVAGDIAIGTTSLDIRKYVEKVASSMDALIKTSTLSFVSQKEEDVGVNIGSVTLEMQVLPQAEATLKPVGIERQDPNVSPQLMTPMEGRGWDSVLPSLAFSLPSFGFYKKVLPLLFLTLLCLVGLKYVGLL